MTVVSSRCPFVFTRSTQKPLSSLWKGDALDDAGDLLRHGLAFWDAAFMFGDSFSHGGSHLGAS